MNLYLYQKLGNDARFVLDEDIGLSFMNFKANRADSEFSYQEDNGLITSTNSSKFLPLTCSRISNHGRKDSVADSVVSENQLKL